MKQTRSDDSRHKLLESAFQEIYKSGFQSASISSILAETGLTKGALYHHFPTKKELGLAVIDEMIYQNLKGRIFDTIQNAESPLDGILSVLSESKNRSQLQIDLGCPLNNLIQEMSPLDSEFNTHLVKVVKRWQAIYQEALELSQKRGEIRQDIDTKETALFIFAARQGCISAAKTMQSKEVLASCLDRLYDYVLSLKN